LTDIIILVVAADEGLKPQTIESINLAKEAQVPVVVAINKIDKPGADPDMVKRALSDNGLVPEDWGGDTICVPCSAKTGVGIDTLLDMVLLVADVKQFTSHPTRPGVATVIESYLDPGQGVVANVLVNAGILNRGDAVLCGEACGKIRTMKNAFGKNISEATSSMPVQMTGLDVVPEGGQILQVMSSLDIAREKAQAYKLAASSKSINKFEQASLGNLMNRLKTGTLQYLKVVIKADTNGSMEALKASLSKIQDKDVAVKIIHAGIGAINESDVLMAGTSSAIIVAFNVPVGPNALSTLSKSKIEVISEKVIYRIIEKVENIVTGMIDVKYDQILIGEGKALKIFYTGEKMQIVGLSVTSGNVQKRAQVKIIRNERVAGTGLVENLKQVGEEVSQVEEGNECGIQYK
jgi:translation initiation factor IF-2